MSRLTFKQTVCGKGYARVSLSINGKFVGFNAHRVICECFYGKSELHVNHKNGIKHDNRPENLEYCSNEYNHREGFSPRRKLNYYAVILIRLLSKEGYSNQQISDMIEYTRQGVYHIVKGDIWKE